MAIKTPANTMDPTDVHLANPCSVIFSPLNNAPNPLPKVVRRLTRAIEGSNGEDTKTRLFIMIGITSRKEKIITGNIIRDVATLTFSLVLGTFPVVMFPMNNAVKALIAAATIRNAVIPR